MRSGPYVVSKCNIFFIYIIKIDPNFAAVIESYVQKHLVDSIQDSRM